MSHSSRTAHPHFFAVGPTHSARICVRSASTARRRRPIARITEFEMELLAQHLKGGELADEVGVWRAAGEQFQHVADVAQLDERQAQAARFLELAPEPDEDRELQQALLGRSLLVRKAQRKHIQTARLALRKRAVLALVAAEEGREPGSPQLVELAVGRGRSGRETPGAERPC